MAIGIGSGVLSVVNGPAPTGSSIVDAVLVGTSVAMITWFASVNSIRFSGVIALLAGAFSLTGPGLVLGIAAYVLSVRVRIQARSSPLFSAGLVGLALNVASRSELDVFLGASAIVAIALAIAVVLRAFPSHERHARRVAVGTIAASIAVAVASVVALAATSSQSVDDLREGERIARRGLDLLGDGDVRGAQASFEVASVSFDRAHSRLSSRANAPAALVPVVAQHRRAAIELSAQAASSSDTLADELTRVDLDQLVLRNGRIDVNAIAALEDPLTLIQTDIADFRSAIDGLDGPWLTSPLRDELTDLGTDLDEQLTRGDRFVRVVQQVPSMLGAEGRRVYFVAFTTPSEARGLGGFMGNWAEITIENGDLEITADGRSDDLDVAAVQGGATLTGPSDWLRRYGNFDFDDSPANGTGQNPWKNITVSPDMAATGQVIAELYPQSGGRPIDGVFIVDVFALSALLEFTGPIELPNDLGTVDSETAPKFLLNDQYELTDTDARVDVLDVISREAFDRLLSTDLPPAADMIDALGPMVEEGRLAAYAVAPREQDLLDQAGLTGTLDDPESRDGLAITLNNAIGNKIDFFLRSAVSYSVVADQVAGTARAELDIMLENQAPKFGEPNYVIGNAIGYADGSNRVYVSIYSRLPVERVEVDGRDVAFDQDSESGYFVASVFVDLASRATSSLHMDMAGPLDTSNGYALALRNAPAARQIPVELDLRLIGEDQEFRDEGVIRRAGAYEFVLGQAQS